MNTDVKKARLLVDLFGCVQGVGLRPTIYRIASSYSLTGIIFNNFSGAHLDLEGPRENLNHFIRHLQNQDLKPIHIKKLNYRFDEILGHNDLRIIESRPTSSTRNEFSIPPDLATCHECWEDFFNPEHRLYQYPFISCAQCGPRWSILKALPYDRSSTSMNDFKMCSDCTSDYSNPQSRRFHAQTLSCHQCGPQLSHPLEDARNLLAQNKIGLIKGLTGYHLMGNALSPDVINRIRRLKERPEKALAVMVKESSIVGELPWSLLRNEISPIIITNQVSLATHDQIAPGLNSLGILAPPTPLHFMLFGDLNFLIATSANPKAYPLIRNIKELPPEWISQIDFILDHDRQIIHSVDDSILNNSTIMRRGRGLAPKMESVQGKYQETIIAWGADMKSAPLIQTPHQRIQLPYLGELSHPLNINRVQSEVQSVFDILKLAATNELIDAHPKTAASYLTQNKNVTKIFHHHAHAESVYQEHRTSIVFTFDGTGFGEDQQHWGGELLEKSREGHWKRVLSFEPMPYFAGEEMIKKPYLSLACMKYQWGMKENATKPFIERSTIKTTSAGRWFDALAAHLFLKEKEISYEGQAAICLEQNAREPLHKIDWNSFPFETLFPTLSLARTLIFELSSRYNANELAWLAHDGLAYLMARAVSARLEKHIGASGGVFQNQLLISRCHHYFSRQNKVLLIGQPCNDESLALGQIGVFECMN